MTKNITEIFSLSAHLQVDYVYTPFGQVREDGVIPQPIRWSSEMHDAETGLVYYNYRYYNPRDGKWTRRDPAEINRETNLYCFVNSRPIRLCDFLGRNSERDISFKRHLGRTLTSFNNGIELFIGSADGKVDVSIVQKDNQYYVRATYTVHNDTSLTSLFYHLVDSVEKGIMKTWTQYYIGEEYFPSDCS